VVLLGGDFVTDPPSTHGAGVVAEIGRVAADIAFASPFGLNDRDGATSFIPDEAEIARAMFAHAGRRVVLADRSKLGRRGRVAFARLDEVDHIVMDAEAARSEHFAALSRAAGKRLVTA
jgi:DeoR/GlpR family transcriptional regulator of sugar metabolism